MSQLRNWNFLILGGCLLGRNLMAGAARRVWEELYACKKPAIEEVFKVTLSAPVGNARAPDLPAARDHLADAAHRLWLNYIDTERKVQIHIFTISKHFYSLHRANKSFVNK